MKVKKHLCIILQSLYDDGLIEAKEWNDEVNNDLFNVKITLLAHTITSLVIDVNLKNPDIITKMVHDKITAETQGQSYEYCHIVVNTHGVPGMSDLPDLAVQTTLQALSTKGIKVTQLSLLQCHAMSKNKNAPSSAQIICDTLCGTTTSIPQTFKIIGPNKEYAPTNDEELVTDILEGTNRAPYIQSLVVTTQSPALKEEETQDFSEKRTTSKLVNSCH